ncbi:MAG: hypothetical protein NW224_29270 [Leptolyngbyaceae cyanobacterium bins.302]|nr:hypothetical protein [Leptolyngbyaceae cyanobacterium bins.302]
MKSFKVNEIWQVGFRIYYGDSFVSISPFEQDAYSFFSKYKSDPTFGATAHDYCKRINKVYTQNYENLLRLKEELESSDEFKDVELNNASSAIGLPKVLVYTHVETGIRTEFDGVVFLSEKQVTGQSFEVEDAKTYVASKGKIYLDNVQMGSTKNAFENESFLKVSAHCNWMYVTNSVDFKLNKFNQDIDPNNLILSISLIDNQVIRFNMPHGTIDSGEKYHLLIGRREHIREVIAHDFETYRYLKFLEERLKVIRDDLLQIQGNLFTGVPLLPWSLKLFIPNTWSNAIKHSSDLHRCLEKVIKYRLYLPSFEEIFSAYEEYEDKGIGFYNLPNPIIEDGKFVMSQYSTFSPAPLEITDSKIEVRGDIKSLRIFNGYPSRLKDFVSIVQRLADETFELLQSITVTPALQTGMVAAVVSLLAMLISIITFIFSPAISNIYGVFQSESSTKVSEPQQSQPIQPGKSVLPNSSATPKPSQTPLRSPSQNSKTSSGNLERKPSQSTQNLPTASPSKPKN